MRKYITIAGIIFLTGVFVLPMVALGQAGRTGQLPGKMMGMERGLRQGGATGGQLPGLTAEQRNQIEDLLKKFRDDNADTLKQLMTMNFDLNTILDADNPDADKAKAIQKEISDLNAQLAQKRIDFYIEMRKINPDAKFGRGGGRGFGMQGMKGPAGKL